MADLDQSLPLLIKGYAWLPDLRRRTPGRPAETRLAGRRAVAVAGPEAAAFFYAPGQLERRSALPPTVVNTLFGRGAVHTLDGPAHRARKAMFVGLLNGDGVDTLAKQAGEAFDEAAAGWRGGPAVSLFEETATVIAGTVTRWAGVPVDDRDRPDRFVDREIGDYDPIPQGGGDPRTGHRCPGELITIALLGTFAQRLARLDYYLPPQDLTIDLSRMPARPADGVRIMVR